MKKKEMISDFIEKLHNENANRIDADNGLDDLFGKDKLFSVVCNKCASLDIEIIGEAGVEYGGQTGYCEGTTAIKCNSCGSALTIYG